MDRLGRAVTARLTQGISPHALYRRLVRLGLASCQRARPADRARASKPSTSAPASRALPRTASPSTPSRPSSRRPATGASATRLAAATLRAVAAGLSCAGSVVGERHARGARHDAEERRASLLHHAPIARRVVAVEHALAQSGDHRADAEGVGRQSHARRNQPPGRYLARARHAAGASRRRARGRQGSRRHAGRGRLPQRADGAHPVQAGHGASRGRAGADRAGLDHEILRARFEPAQFARALSRRARLHRVHGVVAQSHRRGSRPHLRCLPHQGRHGGARCRQRHPACPQGPCRRLLHRRHAARHRRGDHGARRGRPARHHHAASPRRPISARPAS